MSTSETKRSGKNKIVAFTVGLVVVVVFGVMWTSTGGGSRRGYSIAPTGTPVTADTRIGLSTRVQIKSQGEWYEAKVIKVNKDGTFKVHFDGWDSRYDETVTREEMLLSPLPTTAP